MMLVVSGSKTLEDKNGSAGGKGCDSSEGKSSSWNPAEEGCGAVGRNPEAENPKLGHEDVLWEFL